MNPAALSLPEPLPVEYSLDLRSSPYTLRCFGFVVSDEGINFRLLALGATGTPHPVQRDRANPLLPDSASSVSITAKHTTHLDIEIVSASEHSWPEWCVTRFAAELRVRVNPPHLESDVLIIANSNDRQESTLVLPRSAVQRAFPERLALDVSG